MCQPSSWMVVEASRIRRTGQRCAAAETATTRRTVAAARPRHVARRWKVVRPWLAAARAGASRLAKTARRPVNVSPAPCALRASAARNAVAVTGRPVLPVRAASGNISWDYPMGAPLRRTWTCVSLWELAACWTRTAAAKHPAAPVSSSTQRGNRLVHRRAARPPARSAASKSRVWLAMPALAVAARRYATPWSSLLINRGPAPIQSRPVCTSIGIPPTSVNARWSTESLDQVTYGPRVASRPCPTRRESALHVARDQAWPRRATSVGLLHQLRDRVRVSCPEETELDPKA